jgi:four helix bundle protein
LSLGYRNNIAWQKNQEAIVKTAGLIEELPGVTPYNKIAEQLFASVASVGANIAEGFSDFKGNEYQRYLKISLRSAYETDHWLTTLQSLSNGSKSKINREQLQEINNLNIETIKILKKTIESIKKKRAEEKLGLE